MDGLVSISKLTESQVMIQQDLNKMASNILA